MNKKDLQKAAKMVGSLPETKAKKSGDGSSADSKTITRGVKTLKLVNVYERNKAFTFRFQEHDRSESIFWFAGKMNDENEASVYKRILDMIQLLTNVEYNRGDWVDYFADNMENNGRKLIGKSIDADVRRRTSTKKHEGEYKLLVFKDTKGASVMDDNGYTRYVFSSSTLDKKVLNALRWDDEHADIEKRTSYDIVKVGEEKIGFFTEPFIKLEDCVSVDEAESEVDSDDGEVEVPF